MRNIITVIAVITCCISISVDLSAQAPDKRTAFPEMTFVDNHPYVPYQGQMVKLLGMADRPIQEYIDLAISYNAADWQHDLVRYTHYMWDDLGIERGDSIQVMIEVAGRPLTTNFALHVDHRESATTFYEQQVGENRITRVHQREIPEQYAYLTIRLDGYEPTAANWLSAEAARHDLEHLEWQIVNNYAYRKLTGFDHELAIDAIIADLDRGITKADFALQLKILMANFGDGHTGVSMYRAVLTDKEKRGNLPFQFIKHEERFYAVNPAKNDYYHPDFPQITAINGEPIETWYALAESMVPKTTPGFVENQTLRYLTEMGLLLRMQKATSTDEITATFSGANGVKLERVPVGNYRHPAVREMHLLQDSILADNIGYLAMNDKMEDEDEFLEGIHQAMQRMKDTDGLVIDIRDNGGGSRAPLHNILPYLVRKPMVVNAARFRVDAKKNIHPPNGYLERRYAYPENYAEWTSSEKSVIMNFSESFQPVYEIEDAEFSRYHYSVVGPETIENEAVYYYDKPVIVLIDAGCFSASDIFAAGIREGDNVRLLGETTGGGSGFTKSRTLPNSGIAVRMSRIVSYQPDGNLYDGHGVAPDVVHPYTLSDKLGRSDSMLAAALELLSK